MLTVVLTVVLTECWLWGARISCQTLKTANMLWKSRQRNTFTAYTACEAGDNAELQTCQVLSVKYCLFPLTPKQDLSEKNEVAEFSAAVWVFIVDLLESLV